MNNVCQCPNGYEGSRCERMIDYCTQPGQNQCLNGGTCRSHPDMATTLCECPPEYSGQFCQDDVNECQDGGNSPCVNGGQCINHVSDYNTDMIQWKLHHPFNTHILKYTPHSACTCTKVVQFYCLFRTYCTIFPHLYLTV